MVLGADVSIGHDEGHPVNAISAADLTMAFRYVFAAAAAGRRGAVPGTDGGATARRPRGKDRALEMAE